MAESKSRWRRLICKDAEGRELRNQDGSWKTTAVLVTRCEVCDAPNASRGHGVTKVFVGLWYCPACDPAPVR